MREEEEGCVAGCARRTWADGHTRVPMHNPLRTLGPHDTYLGGGGGIPMHMPLGHVTSLQRHVGYAHHVMVAK